MKTPPVGTLVLFYLQGDLGTTPTPALVQQITPNSDPPMLELTLIGHMRMDLTIARGVRHASDQVLENERIRIKSGCWDTIENGEFRRLEAAQQKKQAAKQLEQEKLDRDKKVLDLEDDLSCEISELWQKGNPATEIAEQMARKHGGVWTHQRVNGILKRKKILQPS